MSPICAAILASGLSWAAVEAVDPAANVFARGDEWAAHAEPSGGAGRAQPWDQWADRQREVAAARLSQETSRIGALAQIPEAATRSGPAVVYADTDKAERRLAARESGRLIERVIEWIGAEPDCAIAWQPIVQFEFASRETYELIHAAVSDANAVTGPAVALHLDGPVAIVLTGPERSGQALPHKLHRSHAVVRAALHLCHAPGSLPPWAEHGLAWYWAMADLDDSAVDAALREPGLQYIRSGGDVHEVLTTPAGDVGHEDSAELTASIGYLAVRGMMRRDEAATADWAAAVMKGERWQEALGTTHGRSPQRFARELADWHRVND